MATVTLPSVAYFSIEIARENATGRGGGHGRARSGLGGDRATGAHLVQPGPPEPVLLRGLLFLFGATALYLLSVLGIGLFISTVSRTQQQALMSSFFFFQPAMLLSGFVFPIANMPEAIQYLTYVNPLRYFLVIIRGIFLKGSGPAVLSPEMLALFALGVAILAISTLRFRKRLE